MHSYMAADAFAARLESQSAVRNLCLCVIASVALQAEMPAFASHQKQSVAAAVRIVAGHTPFHFYRGMFEDKWTALLYMALHAGF